ncbi:helix-turn-helix domain-containing protein, partial [Bittarella massiliensis (ex Durand et al. 2017)]
PARYAQRRRLTEAALQLSYTHRPLADIALAAGYESQQAFTAACAAFYKQPPRAFREEGRFYPLLLRHRPRQLSARGARRFGAVRPAQREDIPAWTE